MSTFKITLRVAWWVRPCLLFLAVAKTLGLPFDLEAAASRVVRRGITVVGAGKQRLWLKDKP